MRTIDIYKIRRIYVSVLKHRWKPINHRDEIFLKSTSGFVYRLTDFILTHNQTAMVFQIGKRWHEQNETS